nr:hypothetical protein [Tanacetum cinerariifolium]
NSSSPALQDDLILSVFEQLKTQVVNYTKINQDNKNINEILTAKLERYKHQEITLKEKNNVDNASVSYEQSLEIEKLKHTLSFRTFKRKGIFRTKEETLLLAVESHSKMLQKQNEPIMLSYQLNKLFWSRYSVQPEEPNLSASTTIVEVTKELPKTIKQHCVEKNKFQHKMKNVLKDNDRLLEKAISVDIVNIVVYDHVNFADKTVNVCERCVPIETELQKNFINKDCYDTLSKKFNTLKKH